ncbi:hypothetical protein B0H15DRAFT_954608 [Mycena belliarum]|uniref:Uncharacterized protein n=1 Tax=Mycena belliarum TaxID=1033014 RepID=A0AAD6TUM8_9AGAR|nr:hypothetical protein B0H15DRAFT_954608 [Mycena belliae]
MAVPLIFADMTEEELRKYRKLASSRIYNFKNAEVRNEKSRLRMAKHRAEEALLSADELEARRARRREATQRYREKNRERLAVAEKKRRRRYLKKPELKLKPPLSFIPCPIPEHLGDNWDNHASFSAARNKTYWVLFMTSRQGAYSLKVTCIRALASTYAEEETVGSFQKWDDVLVFWGVHCFNRHGRCPDHRDQCALGACRAHLTAELAPHGGSFRIPGTGHPRHVMKQERHARPHSNVSGKREHDTIVQRLPLIVSQPSRAAARCAPPSYTPVAETESDGSDVEGVPLFDLKSDDEVSPVKARGKAVQALHREENSTRGSASIPETYTPATLSSVSSLAQSSSVVALEAGGKARPTARASSVSGAGAAHASDTRLSQRSTVPAQVAAESDPFYVTGGGTIYHSHSAALAVVGAGPVRVVIGWEAATEYAIERAVQSRKGKERSVDI